MVFISSIELVNRLATPLWRLYCFLYYGSGAQAVSASPSNTAEKRALYFEAGAQEVWTCSLDGKLRFQVAPGQQVITRAVRAYSKEGYSD
jgi:hypothetical protein